MKNHCIGFVMFFFAALIFSSCNGNNNLSAKEGEPAGGFLWENNFSEITITGYQGASNDITIPKKINGKPVTQIAEYTFAGFAALNSVKIPDSVKAIDSSAFHGCSSLTGIVIPDSVTTIGSSAFKDCISLTDIVIPDSVTSISYSMFYGCSSLTGIVIPDSVTFIGEFAFSCCNSLTSITYTGTITQWNQIRKGVAWSDGNYTIHCTDGDISK